MNYNRFFALLGVAAIFVGSCNRTVAQSYPEMITVQGGTFTMGDNAIAPPEHQVTLKTFNIAKTPITVAQYTSYCKATGHKMPEAPSWGQHDANPIVNVSWDDAVAYCDWLSVQTGKLYRLPTEAEYEYAARGGQSSKGFKYSGSQSMDVVGWYKGNSDGHAHAVATKKANELGLYDMSGNVWEWCSDWYGAYSDAPSSNPKGPSSGYPRVLRGGSWSYSATDCLIASRTGDSPSDTDDDNGFRVVSME